MGVLDRFSPGQRQALLIGAPVAAGLAVVSALRKRNAPTAATAATTTAPSTDAVGVGQLSEFESGLTDSLTALYEAITQQPAPAANPTPAPAAQPDPTQAAPVYTPPVTSPQLPQSQWDLLVAQQGGPIVLGPGQVPSTSGTPHAYLYAVDQSRVVAG